MADILLEIADGGEFGCDEFIRLDARTRHAVLATSADDRPYTSLLVYAYDAREGVFIFLTPKGSTKYRNLTRNPNVSLLIDTRRLSKGYLGGEAYTVTGQARAIRAGKRRDRVREVFLLKHPELSQFSNQPGIALVAVSIERCTKVGRFQRVSRLNPAIASAK